jgi:hypothetical protein
MADQFVEGLSAYPDGYRGRGIVTCAGGVRLNTCAWVLIGMLRRFGCELPIQVWYRGEAEYDPHWGRLVREMGVDLVDAEYVARRHPRQARGGWELKPYSILHSPFREVLFLDADNVPVVDPNYLFDSPEFRRAGAVFWPDGTRTPADDRRWQVFGVEFREEPEQESGQLLIDKQACWEPLQLCNWYNQHSHFYYQHVYGDKDTFRFAWHRLGRPFAMPERPLEQIPFTLCQHDFGGRRVFQHRSGDKWSLSGNPRSSGFLFEEECRELVQRLREIWDPHQRLTGDLSAADREQMNALAARPIEFHHVGHNRWGIRLGVDGYVQRGWTQHEFFWWIKDRQLIFANTAGQPTGRLRRRDDGVWEGCREERPNIVLRLTVGESWDSAARSNGSS